MTYQKLICQIKAWPEKWAIWCKVMTAEKQRIINQVSKLSRLLLGDLRKRLTEAGLDISPVQSAVLFLLMESDGRKLGEMAALVGVDNSALTRLADRMEKAGLIERRVSPGDRRATLVFITDKGGDLAGRAAEVVGRANQNVQEGFEPQEFEAFVSMLDRLIDRYGDS